MRLAWYAGASAALATSVVVSAFHQRPNFYSAMVYLSQSSLCLMILANWTLIIYGTFMYGLQRLCYGALRPIEIEQLYEKAWFAVTETCLAMTIFREEVGAWFLVMFTLLVTGKVWGWIGDGRVEVFEQQPPSNPTLFHTRLSASLLLSVVYDLWLLGFCISSVIQQAKPNMMVMFLFEFAILTVSSGHTALRYILSLVEVRINARQLKQRLEERRKQVREERAAIVRRREAAAAAGEEDPGAAEPLPDEADVDELDIEVPGWEAKGQWVLTLDLLADFLKLSIYTAFFSVLMTFYGLPIHIMRDLFMTTRSFVKRLGALLRYRQAVRDMSRYPDATGEELGRENTCIICREEMRPWDTANPGQVERTRPKKLPCGHILHYGCLKSWLERQQACPTCRQSVVVGAPPTAGAAQGNGMVFRFGLNLPGGAQNQALPPPANNGLPPVPQAGQGQAPPNQAGAGANNENQAHQPRGNGGVRMFNLGPLRLGFAQGGAADLQEMARRMGLPDNRPGGLALDGMPMPAPPPAANITPPHSTRAGFDPATAPWESIQAELAEIGHRLQHDINSLRNTQAEMQALGFLVQELNRIRQVGDRLDQLNQQRAQSQGQEGSAAAPAPQVTANTAAVVAGQAMPLQPTPTLPLPPNPPFAPFRPFAQMGPMGPFAPFAPRPSAPPATMTRHTSAEGAAAIPAGSADLPEGVAIPPGWSLLPLQRMGGQQGATVGLNGQTPTAATQADPLVRINGLDNGAALGGGGGGGGTTGQTPAPGTSTSSVAHDNSADTASGDTRSTYAPPVTLPHNGLTVPRPSSNTSWPLRNAPPDAGPAPAAPNWGGSAQLFASRSVAPPSSSRTGSASQPHASQSESVGPTRTGSTEDQPLAAGPDHGTTSNEKDSAESSADKGKGKAVTVEEADDEQP